MVVEYLEQIKKQFVDKSESLLDEISSLEIKYLLAKMKSVK